MNLARYWHARLPFVLFATVATAVPYAQTGLGSPGVQAGSDVGAISGSVTEANGQPVVDAIVSLFPLGNPAARVPAVRTDERGRFVFTPIPAPTTYYLSVVKAGYIDGVFSRTAASTEIGDRIELRARQWLKDVTIHMVRYSALNGRVLDASSQPVIGAHVVALQRIVFGATERWVPRVAAMTTDDRGVYELAVPPGKYKVLVPSTTLVPPVDGLGGVRSEGSVFYSPTYFPSVLSVVSANEIEVGEGDRRDGIDLQLRSAPAFRVSGRLVGRPAGVHMILRLLEPQSVDVGSPGAVAVALPDADGTFVFASVPEGTYVLDGGTTLSGLVITQAAPSSRGRQSRLPRLPGSLPGSSGLSMVAGPESTIEFQTVGGAANAAWGRVTITVDGEDLKDVVVPVRPATSISGRVRWEDGPPQPLSPGRLTAEPMAGATSQPYAFARESGADGFEISGLSPGAYFLVPARRIFVKSIVWRGDDYTYRPLVIADSTPVTDVELTLTALAGSVSGAVTGLAEGNRASVVYFPFDDSERRHFGLTPHKTGAVPVIEGQFQVPSLPAGEYWFAVAVVPGPLAVRDPEFLTTLVPQAQRVKVGWGEALTQNLRWR